MSYQTFLDQAAQLYRSAERAEEEAEQYLDMAREAGASEEEIDRMLLPF